MMTYVRLLCAGLCLHWAAVAAMAADADSILKATGARGGLCLMVGQNIQPIRAATPGRRVQTTHLIKLCSEYP